MKIHPLIMITVPVITCALIFAKLPATSERSPGAAVEPLPPLPAVKHNFLGLSVEEAQKTLVNAYKAIQSQLQQRSAVGSTRQEVESGIKRLKNGTHFIYIPETELAKSRAVVEVLLFMGYKNGTYRSVLIVSEPFVIEGRKYDVTSFYMFDRHGKLIKGVVSELLGEPGLDDVKAMLRKDIRTGASRAQVGAWLKAKKIRYFSMDAKKHDIGSESDVSQSAYKAAELNGFMRAHISNFGMTYPVIWSHRLLFFFGKDDRLKGYSVTTVGFGP